jgi:type IV pilus assembly protein PilY1
MWGNPIAEMMYEGVRYLAGKGAANPDFNIVFGQGEESGLPGGGLPVATWDNPYVNKPVCTKPFETVISDINPSYDTDQLPGSAFGSFSDSNGVPGLNVATEAQTIWNSDVGGTKQVFIGESGAIVDNAPTPKSVSSFGNIRGLAPEEPTKRGGYYSASVAYFGHKNDINTTSAAPGDQKLNTFAVALASPLPKIEIPLNGRTITLVPFAKSVNGAGISASASFQPTDQIVDFYVDELTPTHGKFRVNFEDVEQGADHDMDAITVYTYDVVGSSVQVKLESEYAAGGITQHMGYVISGTTADGIYLEVLDRRDGDVPGDVDYFLDTPPAFTGTPPAPSSGAQSWNDSLPLPFITTRTFTPGSTGGATLLKDPLWYAAKWGGFTESSNGNNIPDVAGEWDADGNGEPDNYFLVTNALTLSQQLSKAFADIIERVASGSSASVNSGSITSQSRLYQAKFNSGNWTGELLAYPINADGSLSSTPSWNAATTPLIANTRNIITVNTDGTGVPFRWPGASPTSGIDLTRQHQLDNATATPFNATLQQDRLNYVRGDSAEEAANGGLFRSRPTTKFGDVINSSPVFVGRPTLTYSDTLEATAYSTFRDANVSRQPVVYVGANDGMLHAFNANNGDELFGFIPGAVFGNLKTLSNRGYTHKFFVDGTPTVADAYFNGSWKTVLAGGLNTGGQGIYALNVTDPSTFSEANAEYNSSSNPNGLVLWEFTDANDVDMGYSYSQPIIVRTKNATASQRWVAIFGNGYNSTIVDGRASSTGEAVLYVVDLATGSLIKKISTGVGMSAAYSGGKPNGLASPTAADLDGDGIVESVYAGDLFGNLWKFDLNNTNPNNWDVAYKSGGTNLPLFVATDSSGVRQAITAQPRVVRGPGSTGAVVSFGTGKFLEPTDATSTAAQTLYGVYDAGATVTRSQLVQQTIDYEFTQTVGANPVEIRITSDNQQTTTSRGWYMDLLTPPYPPGTQAGERMIANPRVRNGRVLFVTVVPGADPCVPGGKTRLIQLDVTTGVRPSESPFDLNGDGTINDADMVQVTLANGTQISMPVSSVTVAVDYGTSPGVISSSNFEVYYISGDDRDRTGPTPCLTGNDICGIRGSPGDNARGRQSWRQIR